jgi:uracil-DNA glycosylase family 4
LSGPVGTPRKRFLMPSKSELNELIAGVKEQVLYLEELGVESLDVSLPEQARNATTRSSSKPIERFVPDAVQTHSAEKTQTPEASGRSRLAKLPSLAGVPKRGTGEVQAASESYPVIKTTRSEQTEELFEMSPTLNETTDTIESLRAEIGNCTRCELHSGRTQIVHSTGNFDADLMFVGEAPGADEDEQGFPFVGRAGQLLTKIIESIGLKREDVFIGNINRCRPPGNRQPLPAETAACRPFLLREVAVVRPKVIVVLGNTATQNLLNIKTPISKLRGQFQDYFGVKVMPTFHPAYLLRDPHKKREVWDDMKKVRDYLNSI